MVGNASGFIACPAISEDFSMEVLVKRILSIVFVSSAAVRKFSCPIEGPMAANTESFIIGRIIKLPCNISPFIFLFGISSSTQFAINWFAKQVSYFVMKFKIALAGNGFCEVYNISGHSASIQVVCQGPQ